MMFQPFHPSDKPLKFSIKDDTAGKAAKSALRQDKHMNKGRPLSEQDENSSDSNLERENSNGKKS